MEREPHTRLAGECLQPLGHLSGLEAASVNPRSQSRRRRVGPGGPPEPTPVFRTALGSTVPPGGASDPTLVKAARQRASPSDRHGHTGRGIPAGTSLLPPTGSTRRNLHAAPRPPTPAI